LGLWDWGLGIGPNPQSPIPNPQSPIPNPQVLNLLINDYNILIIIKVKNFIIDYNKIFNG